MINALKCGIGINEFWDYSLKELNTIVRAKTEQMESDMKAKTAEIYTLAAHTAAFVGRMLNGERIPSFSEMYPDTNLEDDVPKQNPNWQAQLLNFQNYTMNKERFNQSKRTNDDN